MTDRRQETETLPRSFYARATEVVARDLLGMILVHHTREGRVAGRIVETEAYLGPGDPASHAHRGPTPRSSVMFGHPGLAYVYFNYGMYHLFNVVTEDHGTPGAVLMRALEPLEGVDRMGDRRAARGGRAGAMDPKRLADGPGKLTIAMGIDLAHNGRDLTRGDLRIARGSPVAEARVERSARVGIRVGTERLLRFYVKGDPHVSKVRPPSATPSSRTPSTSGPRP